jgi:hypothetical protein
VADPFHSSFRPARPCPNYAYFSTYRPVNFDDCDDVGARVTSASALFYTWTYLTLWDGGAYKSKQLAYVRVRVEPVQVSLWTLRFAPRDALRRTPASLVLLFFSC